VTVCDPQTVPFSGFVPRP